MRQVLFLFLFFCFSTFLHADANVTVAPKGSAQKSKSIWENKNIWIKTYANARNYNIIINNIVKIEQKIKKTRKGTTAYTELHARLEVQKSKLELYERNKSFDRLLLPYKFEVGEISIYDYLFQKSKDKLEAKIEKFILLKNQFYLASSLLSNYAKNDKTKKRLVLPSDIIYFEEFAENIDKTYLNLLEARDELNAKYVAYNNEKLQKHIFTLLIIFVSYTIYKFLSIILLFIERKIHKEKNQNNYRKILSISFFILLFVFLVVRYLEDFIYIITFLSVVAAALTIALREVILNIIGSVYIFFSNMARVGDRIMIQFETKHTIGDIVDISLMKIKLNEIEDYTNVKEVKNVGRTIYIPNSYVFTKVFYNYSRKKDGIINDLIEFEFTPESDFAVIENVTNETLDAMSIAHTINFTLNSLKTGVVAVISYQTNYKQVGKTRGKISIELLRVYTSNASIMLKGTKPAVKEDTKVSPKVKSLNSLYLPTSLFK